MTCFECYPRGLPSGYMFWPAMVFCAHGKWIPQKPVKAQVARGVVAETESIPPAPKPIPAKRSPGGPRKAR